MFSRLRNFSKILNHSRLPVKVSSNPNARVYRVRFLPPQEKRSSFPRNALLFTGYGFLAVWWYQTIVSLADDKPIFIPIGFAKEVPSQQYKPTDPEVMSYHRFRQDSVKIKRVRETFKNITLKALLRTNGARIGENARVDASMLYFHFPAEPPPKYVQRGIRISYNRNLSPAAGGSLMIETGTRETEQHWQLQKNRIMYPVWVYRAVKAGVHDLMHVFRTPRNPESDPVDAIQFGAGLAHWSFFNFKDDLRKTRGTLPPPRGHVMIDGLVQIASDTMVISVDISGSFNPNNTNEMTIQKMYLRFVGRIGRTRPAQIPPSRTRPFQQREDAAALERRKRREELVRKLSEENARFPGDATNKPDIVRQLENRTEAAAAPKQEQSTRPEDPRDEKPPAAETDASSNPPQPSSAASPPTQASTSPGSLDK